MKIRVDELKDKTIELSAEEPPEAYPNLLKMQEAGECRFTVPLRINLTIAREYDHIRVNGRVETSLVLNCARCLAEYRMDITSPFTIFYMREEGAIQDEDVELSEEDLISATYVGDEIDFAGEISEQVILAMPFKPLCSEECRGLCTGCGVDLNKTRCNCERDVMNIKFSALKNLKIN